VCCVYCVFGGIDQLLRRTDADYVCVSGARFVCVLCTVLFEAVDELRRRTDAEICISGA
jgi:hypothetical protein